MDDDSFQCDKCGTSHDFSKISIKVREGRLDVGKIPCMGCGEDTGFTARLQVEIRDDATWSIQHEERFS